MAPADAVLGDPGQSERVYNSVYALALALGADTRDLVPFAAYASAAKSLSRPSSIARALGAGAVNVERIDLLVLRVSEQRGLDASMLAPIVEEIERRLAENRASRPS